MKMAKIRGKYLRLSKETNALDYLEKAYLFIQRADKDISEWKWVILSLFGALYGFAICACRGTCNNLVTYETKKGEKRLIAFSKAIEYSQDANVMGQNVFSKELQMSKRQKDSIVLLHKVFRNQFEHYIPKSWSIEVHCLPKMAMNILDVIRFLAIDCGNILPRLGKRQIIRTKSLILRSKRILGRSQIHKEFIKLANRRDGEE